MRIPWNKGLTKSDPRIAIATEKMRKTKTGVPFKHPKQFKKGMIPWNKGKEMTDEYKKKMNFKGLEIGRGLRKGKMEVRNYNTTHYYVRERKGKATRCEHCGHDGTKGTRCEWANKDHKYSLNLDDYISLCKGCHYLYDKCYN